MSFADDLTCKNCGQEIGVLDRVSEAINDILKSIQRGDFEDIEFDIAGLQDVQCYDCHHSVNPEDFAEWVASNIKTTPRLGFDIIRQKPMIMTCWEQSGTKYRSRYTSSIEDEAFESMVYEYLRLKSAEFDHEMVVTSPDKDFYLEVLVGEAAEKKYEELDAKDTLQKDRKTGFDAEVDQ